MSVTVLNANELARVDQNITWIIAIISVTGN